MSNAFVVTNGSGTVMGLFATEETAIKSVECKYGQVDILRLDVVECETFGGDSYKQVQVNAYNKLVATFDVRSYPVNETVAHFFD